MIVEITDPADPRLDVFAKLRDSQLRQRLEHDRGLFVAEGDKIIRRALSAGCVPHAYLLTRRWLGDLADVLDEGTPAYLASEAFIEQVSGFHVHRGALGVFRRPDEASWETLLHTDRLIVTQGLVDHVNMGSVLRIAAALGWGGVVISHTCADPLYRRAVKASMGASLQVPWRRMENDLAGLRQLKGAGFAVVATTLGEAAIPLDESRPGAKVALLVGNEGHGLPTEWTNLADIEVTIPMAPGVDSLNVAAATAIIAHHFRARKAF